MSAQVSNKQESANETVTSVCESTFCSVDT